MRTMLRVECLGALWVLASCAADPTGMASDRQPGASGAGGGISLGDSGAPPGETDPCNGYDDDGDGNVDEGCHCGPGDKQACFPWKPGEDPVCAPAGEQTCDGSGELAAWGDCVMSPTEEQSELCSWWVVGANAGDQLHVGDGVGWGDATGDGDVDFVAPSVNGQLGGKSVGAAYVLFGSPSLHGKVLDLATQPLTGAEGFAVDNFVAEAAHGHRPTSAGFGDFDGDGLAEAVGTDSASSLLLVRGSKHPQPLYDASHQDGAQAAKLSGAGPSWTVDKATVADFDGDGYSDLFAGGWNGTTGPQCPCSPFGLAVWFGRPTLSAEISVDANVASGIGAIGMGSLGNFSAVAGVGDFDNDGYLDLTSMNGATNDCQQIPQKSYVWYGNPQRTLPSAMNALDGSNGTVVGGGTTWSFGCPMGGTASVSGVDPNHQHGDVDGDGIDDLLLRGVHADAYLFFGKSGGFGATLDAVSSPSGGLSFTVSSLAQPSYHSALGVGDIDADGFDDIVLPKATELWIWWGRGGASGAIDLETASDKSVIPLALLGDADGLITDSKSPSFTTVGDLDGDGFGDVVLGFPNADSKNGAASGAGVVIFGAALYAMHSPSVVRRGSGKDAVVGTPAGELVAAGRGNDVIDSGGGADSIAAGHGDDRITLVDGSFRRVDGGPGVDTLALLAPLALDFRVIGRARVQGIERFDLTATGTQVLAFNAGDLTAMSTTSRDFHVLGSAEDGLTLEGGFSQTGADADGAVVFSRGALRVHVSPELAAKTKLVPST